MDLNYFGFESPNLFSETWDDLCRRKFHFKMFPLCFDDDHLQLKNIAQFQWLHKQHRNIKQASSSSLNLKIAFITAYQLSIFHYLFIVILISYFSGIEFVYDLQFSKWKCFAKNGWSKKELCSDHLKPVVENAREKRAIFRYLHNKTTIWQGFVHIFQCYMVKNHVLRSTIKIRMRID